MDEAGPAVPVESHIPATLLANKIQEPTSGSVKSESQLLQHETDPVVETDRLEKDGADMQEMALQESAQPSSGRMIGESSTKKRKRRKYSGDTSSVQPKSSTSLLGQENTNSARRRRKCENGGNTRPTRLAFLNRFPILFLSDLELLCNDTPILRASTTNVHEAKSQPRGHWRPGEDEKLRQLVEQYSPQNWNVIAEKLEGRSGLVIQSLQYGKSVEEGQARRSGLPTVSGLPKLNNCEASPKIRAWRFITLPYYTRLFPHSIIPVRKLLLNVKRQQLLAFPPKIWSQPFMRL
ncbi:hypothetical protein EJ110_NYTH47030 [Nymphaea thermarum]|nr:hypothetical protein EJ110_NYTH47030 [Nymphaea thermarum]